MRGEVQLGEVAEIIMGQSPPGETYNEHGDGLPFFQGTADFNYRHPTPRVFCTAPSRIAIPGDILLSVRAPIGRVNVADRHCAIGRGLSIVRPKVPEDARYLEFALRMLETTWRAIEGGGSVFGNATRRDLETLRVPWPESEWDRRAIAHILGTLDDKIELNRRMSETLEAMARALFKSWFVDFEPVRAKMEGRWRRGVGANHDSPLQPGLPAHLYDLFPHRLVDSELGEIPEGWGVGTLADHYEAVKGLSYKGSGLGGGLPLHNLNSVYEGGGYKYEGIKYYSGEYAERHIVLPGDVIVANTEQGHDRLLIGYAAIVPSLFGDRGVITHHIYRLRPRPGSPLTSTYLCWLLNSPEMHDVVSGYANGTTVNMLPIDGVQKPLIVVPPPILVATFHSFAMHVERRREGMVVESRTLAALRDALLPKLISGELRVKDAERFLKERGL